ncbi:MAG: IPT/TIG domain-containing protein [Candidatus Sulfotelmatobacter sp.]
MPAISQLNPADATAGGAQFQLEVDGTNFAANAIVYFNSAGEPTTVVSSSKLEAMIPASAIMKAGMVQVTVTNPASAA